MRRAPATSSFDFGRRPSDINAARSERASLLLDENKLLLMPAFAELDSDGLGDVG
jgi:hypothetical protein